MIKMAYKVKNLGNKELKSLTRDQEIVYSYAIEDMKNGHNTLWVERLKKEYPELYEYSKLRTGFKE